MKKAGSGASSSLQWCMACPPRSFCMCHAMQTTISSERFHHLSSLRSHPRPPSQAKKRKAAEEPAEEEAPPAEEKKKKKARSAAACDTALLVCGACLCFVCVSCHKVQHFELSKALVGWTVELKLALQSLPYLFQLARSFQWRFTRRRRRRWQRIATRRPSRHPRPGRGCLGSVIGRRLWRWRVYQSKFVTAGRSRQRCGPRRRRGGGGAWLPQQLAADSSCCCVFFFAVQEQRASPLHGAASVAA